MTELGNGEYLVEFKLFGKTKFILQKAWKKITSFITKNILRLIQFLGFNIDINHRGDVRFD